MMQPCHASKGKQHITPQIELWYLTWFSTPRAKTSAFHVQQTAPACQEAVCRGKIERKAKRKVNVIVKKIHSIHSYKEMHCFYAAAYMWHWMAMTRYRVLNNRLQYLWVCVPCQSYICVNTHSYRTMIHSSPHTYGTVIHPTHILHRDTPHIYCTVIHPTHTHTAPWYTPPHTHTAPWYTPHIHILHRDTHHIHSAATTAFPLNFHMYAWRILVSQSQIGFSPPFLYVLITLVGEDDVGVCWYILEVVWLHEIKRTHDIEIE